MEYLDTIFLGIVQGLTEFLPVSSSGHLVLFQNLLGFREPELLLDTSLHVGTLLAICVYFRSDLMEMVREACRLSRRRKSGGHNGRPSYLWMGFMALVGTIPAVVAGGLFMPFVEDVFASITTVGIMLFATGVILISTRLVSDEYTSRDEVNIAIALTVGCAQAFALLPGISRSGATIACGLLMGLDRGLAGRFSFLMSIPAIIGAVLFQLFIGNHGGALWSSLFLGVVSSAAVGFLALKLLMTMLTGGRLHYFAPYCWIVGSAVVLLGC